MYTPPFKITPRILNLVAAIAAKIERYAIAIEKDSELRLRKANRIKTIHSSLAIEGNELTEEQVSEIINGKTVVAPVREIQEVKNAIACYDMFDRLNPFDEKDMLRAHKVMMSALVDNPGRWRTGGVGVFSEIGCVHMAPPAHRVPTLIADLFEWMKNSEDHLLIRSCVFHYEFEFIHPFADGNGRIGRLWQSLILSRLHPLFAHLPVENMVYSNQQAYYDAITASTVAGESTPFIEFMLGEISDALTSHNDNEAPGAIDSRTSLEREFGIQFGIQFGDNEKRVLLMINADPSVTAQKIAEKIGIGKRAVEKIISRLRQSNIIERVGNNRTGYWKLKTANLQNELGL